MENVNAPVCPHTYLQRLRMLLHLSIALLTLGTGTLRAHDADETAVVVRHAPILNGQGRLEASLQQLLGERLIVNGGAVVLGDLLVPGTPSVVVETGSTFGGVIAGSGATTPTGYEVRINGGAAVRHLRNRIDPVALPVVPT